MEYHVVRSSKQFVLMDTKTGYIILGLGIGQRIGDYLWGRLLTITNSTVDWTGDSAGSKAEYHLTE